MVKLKDIARETGLTVSTVSKALNKSTEISEATTALVQKTAEAMGYKARKSARREMKTIGVILPEVRSHYYAELMHSLNRGIEQQGYTMITVLNRGFGENIQPYVEKICQYDLDGLVISCDNSLGEQSYRTLSDSGVPALLITEVDLPYLMDSIYIKAEIGISLAVEHLISLGHRKIGYVGEYLSDMRYQTFLSILKQHDIEIVPGFMKRGAERFEEGGYLRALELLQGKDRPTAILASYDQVAYGAMRAFREHGVRVPEDISIIGFDNNIMDDYNPVPLTSVTTPVEQMGITAVKILMDAIRHPQTHVVQNVALQSRLVIRNSTCPPGKGE